MMTDTDKGVYTIDTLEKMLHPRNRAGKSTSVCAIIYEGVGRGGEEGEVAPMT